MESDLRFNLIVCLKSSYAMGISFGDLYGSHCITPPVMDDTGYPWTRMNIEYVDR